MPVITIPKQTDKRWIKGNRGELFGIFWHTWNLDLHVNKGRVRISPKTLINIDSSDDADLGLPFAFVRTAADGADKWWAAAGAMFKTASTNPTATMAKDVTASSPTGLSAITDDAIDFDGALLVSKGTDISRLSTTWTASWWVGTLVQTALTSGVPHPLCWGFNDLCLVGDGNFIHTVDTNNNVKYKRLKLPTDFEVTWIKSSNSAYWIGANNNYGRSAKVFYWDGYSENFSRDYKVGSPLVFSGTIKDELPYIINDAGQFMGFTGAGFKELDVFPFFKKLNTRWRDSNTPPLSVHRNGMDVIDGKVHILVNAAMDNVFVNQVENFPSGIWVYDEEIGLHHKYGIGQNRTNGNAKDFGSPTIYSDIGALVGTLPDKGLFLAGVDIHINNSTTRPAVVYLEGDTIAKRGNFITPIIESQEIKNVWQRIWLKFKQFENSTDRIIVKYRTTKNKNFPLYIAITWASTTTFTTTDDFSTAAVGGEIEIIRGWYSGTTAHITAISLAAGTYTVTIDETITGATGTAQIRVQNWTKLFTISSTGISNYDDGIMVKSEWIQFKVELRGTGDSPELEEMKLTSKVEQQAEKD